MSKINFSMVISPEDKAEAAFSARIEEVKAECKRRIYGAIGSEIAQMNMVTNLAGGRMPEEDIPTYKLGLVWVDDMRAACLPLLADPSLDHTDDAHWPTVPDGVTELAARY